MIIIITSNLQVYSTCYSQCITWARLLMHIWTLNVNYSLKTGWSWSSKYKILFQSLKISLREYSLITNKHNQKLINILENQKIYGGFLKILIFRVSLSRTHLQSKTFLFTRLYILNIKIKTFPLGKSLFKSRNKETIV